MNDKWLGFAIGALWALVIWIAVVMLYLYWPMSLFVLALAGLGGLVGLRLFR